MQWNHPKLSLFALLGRQVSNPPAWCKAPLLLDHQNDQARWDANAVADCTAPADRIDLSGAALAELEGSGMKYSKL